MSIARKLYFAVTVIFVAALAGVRSLRLVSLDVPGVVMKGEATWLNCALDLEMDDLYSVKWYKDDVEFYRYLPRDKPAGQKYDLPGVYVDLSQSSEGRVYLQKTDMHTEGVYRCEASAEAPSFQTVEGQKEVKVYILPQEGPTIQGSLPKYEVGDTVNVTCKSGPSKPAATLKWFVNSKEAPNYEVFYPTIDHTNGLQTSTLGLSFTVDHIHLYQGAITLRCTAIVSQVYSMSSEELIVGDKLTDSVSTPVPSRNGPVITGGQARYRVGDLLNVNCTSAKSSPPAELQWFINENKAPSENLIRHPKIVYVGGLEATVLGLQFRVEQKHFDKDDEMRLKCTATLSKVINMRSEERVVGSNHQSSGLHVAENIGTVRNTSNKQMSLKQSLFACLLLLLLLLVPVP